MRSREKSSVMDAYLVCFEIASDISLIIVNENQEFLFFGFIFF